MPGTPAPYAPDPTKWIDTSKSTKKSSTQRPLIALRHGIYTPPPSTSRRGKPLVSRDDSPISRQAGLGGYMTPPTTGSGLRPSKLDRLHRVIGDALKEDTPTNVGKTKVAEKKLDDFWGSSDSEPGPSKPRAAPVVVDLTEDDDHLGGDRRKSISPRKSVSPRKRSRKSPAPTFGVPPLASQPIRSSHLATARSPPRLFEIDESPLESTSPPRPITPIPHSVLREHRRLCGQDTDQVQRIRTAWGHVVEDASPGPSRMKSPSKQIKSRVKAIARDKENDRIKRGLIQLSDEETDKREMKRKKVVKGGEALQSLKVNAGQREFITGFTSPKKSLRRSQSGKILSPIKRSLSHGNSRLSVLDDPPAEVHLEASLQEEFYRSSPSPVASPRLVSPLTPRKRNGMSTAIRHDTTPPKSRSPQKITEHRETLFAFPSPPQPRFSPVKSPIKRDWEPVEWDHAETLMVWGPETMRQTLPPHRTRQRMDQGMDMGRPDPSPIQRGMKQRTRSDVSESESLAPSVPSQSFPNLVRSSPQKQNSDILAAQDGANQEQDEPIQMPCKQPQSDPPLSPEQSISPDVGKTPNPKTATQRLRPEDRWKGLASGILSVPIGDTSTPKVPTPPKASGSKKRKSDSQSPGQTKLAAFGFFPEPPILQSRPSHVAFAKDWDAEEDLDLAEDQDAPLLSSSPSIRGATVTRKSLGKVPEAPHHPGLRPAGVVELRRRQNRSKPSTPSSPLTDVPRSSPTPAPFPLDKKATLTGHTSSSSGQDDTSSLTSEDPLFPENRDEADRAREWFEGIGNRRSSEFGSFRST